MLKALLLLAFICSTAMAGDDRLGFSTHFDQQGGSPDWNPTNLLPFIAATGFGWIRDDGNWQSIETVKGVYDATRIKPFWAMAQAKGLKVVFIVEGNPIYADPYDQVGMSNFCAWLVTQIPGVVIEVGNELNNVTEFKGAAGEQKEQQLTNAVADAVHAVSPSSIVIGYGQQGQEILNMIALGTGSTNGVVAHPYDPNSFIPESCYEPPSTQFVPFIASLRAATPLQIWTTEQGCSSGQRSSAGDYTAALWQSRRLLLSLGNGVEHTFLYTFINSDPSQATVDYYNSPNQSFFMLQRLVPNLSGLTSVKKPLSIVSFAAPGINQSDMYSEVFTVTGGRAVAALWIGNGVAWYGSSPNKGSCTVALPIGRHHTWEKSTAMNVISGQSVNILEPSDSNPLLQPQWTYGGAINNVEVSDQPILLIMP